jgi:hypothetical protein
MACFVVRYLAVISVLTIVGWPLICARSNQKPKLPDANWDLSKSNDVSGVDWPADMKDMDGIASLGGPRKLSLRLANGITISAIVEEINAEKRGNRIWWIGLFYPKMSLKDSVANAKELMSVLDYKSTRIGSWFDEQSQARNPGQSFEEIFRGKKYSLTLKILHSYDKSQPWWTKATIYLE